MSSPKIRSTFPLLGCAAVRHLVLSFTLLLCLATSARAHTDTLDYIGTRPPKGDTVAYFNALSKFWWQVKIVRHGGTTVKFETRLLDTSFKYTDIDTVMLTSHLRLAPQLLNHVYGVHYNWDGSGLLLLNRDTVVRTGKFTVKSDDERRFLNVHNVDYFSFSDTEATLTVIYLPQPGTPLYGIDKINIGTTDAIASAKSEIEDRLKTDFRYGLYYAAFGIVFLTLFLFYREKTENLYFALFCLFCAFYYLAGKPHWVDNDDFTIWGLVFGFEFLGMFFFKIFQGRERSKTTLWMLVGLLVLYFISFAVKWYPTFEIVNNGHPFPALGITIELVAILYALVAFLFFLIQGMNKKSWESKTIKFVCALPLLIMVVAFTISIVLVTVYSYHTNRTPAGNNYVMVLLKSSQAMWIAIHYMYPLSAVIILARRNGYNQTKLVAQVKSIQHLSEENLAKEEEKQQLLAVQNAELERKVAERTAEVTHQKELVELKNREITDNINYALRIQSAILPDINLIYKTLEESFILYMPKDIVSGDFYAFAERARRVILVAGDCTGHGVTGAFMSMIGSSLLNQIINERGVSSPGEILTQLNAAVIATLKQQENHSNDGMDISICAFDLPNRTVAFAGANRPLWLVRGNQLLTVKPDKYPIGGLQMDLDRKFTETIVQLQPQDTVYIFTDGFADQFGGEKGRKMMTAKFKEVLTAAQQIPLRKQETYLRQFFENWKGEHEQVDDVLVIGVRL